MISRLLKTGVACALLWASLNAVAGPRITVFAAASLTNAMNEIATQYSKEKGIEVATSYAASSALAKQIENGAPADILISADLKWMNVLQDKARIQPATRRNLLGNHLVVIAPKGQGFLLQAEKGFDFAKVFDGRLCTGDIEAVPAGIYAKQSLVSLGWWNGIKARVVGAQDVRAALAIVERGECTAGIVYETDARISGKVETLAMLPDESHEPILYPVALTVTAKPEAADLLAWLSTPQARAVFAKYGFTDPVRK